MIQEKQNIDSLWYDVSGLNWKICSNQSKRFFDFVIFN